MSGSNVGKVIDGQVYTHETVHWWGKQSLGTDVVTAARARTHELYDMFDHVCVSFSGGKDSMATFEIALSVAQERGALPLPVIFYDDEVISRQTEAYVERVAARPDVELTWLALPIKERNACTSEAELAWYPWAPEDSHLWAREQHPRALTLATAPWYVDPPRPTDRPICAALINRWARERFPRGSVVELLGIRASESMMRRKIIANRRVDNHIQQKTPWLAKAYPVYDWTTKDIWTAAKMFDWDYNETYDVLEMHGVPIDQQRIGPVFADEPLAFLHNWAECFPDIWDRACARVPGAASAARYATTELYAYDDVPPKPPDMEWLPFIRHTIAQQADPNHRILTAKKIEQLIRRHFKRTRQPILYEPHPISGVGWRALTIIATRGDTKNRKSAFLKQGSIEVYERELTVYRAEQRARAHQSREAKAPA